ncbi:MAG: hypothetical protein QX198_15585 [Methylococcaceae bacterium]
MKPLTPREKRAVIALLAAPIMREQLDTITGASNSPELVAGLRRRGLSALCERMKFLDRDGRVCRPGRYHFSAEDKILAAQILGV